MKAYEQRVTKGNSHKAVSWWCETKKEIIRKDTQTEQLKLCNIYEHFLGCYVVASYCVRSAGEWWMHGNSFFGSVALKETMTFGDETDRIEV